MLAEGVGLVQDDTFYFGNAIGETGNSSSNAFVDGEDFALVREIDIFIDIRNVVDIDRSGFSDATDAAIVRDNPRNVLNSLKLIQTLVVLGRDSTVISQNEDDEVASGVEVMVTHGPLVDEAMLAFAWNRSRTQRSVDDALVEFVNEATDGYWEKL